MSGIKAGSDIVIGSRYLPDSLIAVRQPWYRVMIGRLGNVLIQLLILDGIADTQCGFKAFSYEAGKQVFSRQRNPRWAFDMEILAIARHMGYKILEVPVTWRNDTNRASRLRAARDGYRTLVDLMIIKLNLMSRKYHE